MASNPGDRTLTREQLDAAVAMLQDERAAHPVSPRQRRLLRWFQWAGWTLLGGMSGLFLVTLMSVLLPSATGPGGVHDRRGMLAAMLAMAFFSLVWVLSLLAAFALGVRCASLGGGRGTAPLELQDRERPRPPASGVAESRPNLSYPLNLPWRSFKAVG